MRNPQLTAVELFTLLINNGTLSRLPPGRGAEAAVTRVVELHSAPPRDGERGARRS